jgi:hypothetical protein
MLRSSEALFNLQEAALHVVELERVRMIRLRQSRRLALVGSVSSKGNDREPHGTRNETGSKCPHEYSQHLYVPPGETTPSNTGGAQRILPYLGATASSKRMSGGSTPHRRYASGFTTQ